jgi:hypothetical protein
MIAPGRTYLSDEMVAKIEALAPRYPNRRALTLPALHIVNAELRHVPLQAVVEIAAVLGGDAEFFGAHFGVKAEGNVPAQLDPQGEFTGKNILQQVRPLAESARLAGLTTEQASERLRAALAKLKAVRAARPRPLRDDKVITAWNGLMISALARGARVLGGGEDEKEERERLEAGDGGVGGGGAVLGVAELVVGVGQGVGPLNKGEFAAVGDKLVALAVDRGAGKGGIRLFHLGFVADALGIEFRPGEKAVEAGLDGEGVHRKSGKVGKWET